MEYLSHFNFNICYVKGKLNKVADALSHYYQFNSWDDTPLVQHYVFADVCLDPNHEDLPWDRHLELKNRVIETRSTASQKRRIGEQLRALREQIKEQEIAALRMNAGTEGETSPSPSGNESRDDPSIFESQSKGPNLQEFRSEQDPLNDDI